MDQEKLEEKTRYLFERQGFELEDIENGFKAVKDGEELVVKAFSSRKYSEKDLVDAVSSGEKVFVDEGLKDVQDNIRNDISVLTEEEDDDRKFETPSYEVIGSIAVINDLNSIDREEAVKGILENQSSVETILLKQEGLSGEFRVGEYEKLYGDDTETVHREFGCRFKVDPTKTYFSERFSTERNRVISQIREGEKVLVMFAGIGPFAIMAARNREPGKVVAVEKNPEAVRYLRENIELNQVEDTVKAFEGDVSEVVPGLGSFDRIIMPLPGSADDFLKLAFEHIEEDGIIHYYRFLEHENWNELIEEIEEVASSVGRDYEVLDKVVCGHRAAYMDRVCLDIRAK